ncbi:MAG: two-component system response regulator [Promethearchaeota archaeon]
MDDSKFIIALLKDIMKSKGFTRKVVENTSKAKEELNNHIPKLVFLDVNLPDSNGYEFCKILKSKDEYRNILVYYFTGVSEAEIAIKILERRADGYLKKILIYLILMIYLII